MVEQYQNPQSVGDAWNAREKLPEARARLAQATTNIEQYNQYQEQQQAAQEARKRGQIAYDMADQLRLPEEQKLSLADAASADPEQFRQVQKALLERGAVINERQFGQSEEVKTEQERFSAYSAYDIPDQIAVEMARNEDMSVPDGVKMYYDRLNNNQELQDQRWQTQIFQAQQQDKMDNAVRQVQRSIDKVSPWSAGFMSLSAIVPGTPAYDLLSSLDTQQATIAFRELKAMREASKTGGALGNVSNREIELLYSSFAPLKAGMSPGELRTSLNDILSNFESVRWSLDNEAKYQKLAESGEMSVAEATALMDADRIAHVNDMMGQRTGTPPEALAELQQGILNDDLTLDDIENFEKNFGWRPKQ